VLKLDTVLNQGGAATLSDTLVVDNTSVGALGPTRVSIFNAGGTGAETVGDGILVVEVLNQRGSSAGPGSAPGAFELANGPLIQADGPFFYRLVRGAEGDLGANSPNPGDWFLQNVFVPPSGEGGGGGGGGGSLPDNPPPALLPPGVYPIIGPDLATFGVVQPLARQLGLTTLGTLHERVGDTYAPDCAAPAVDEAPAVDLPTKKPSALPTRKPGPAPCPLFSPSAWARFFGGTTDNRYQAFAGPEAKGNFWGFQGGVDLLRGPLIAGGYDRAGLYGAYGVTNDNVNGLVTNPAATAYVFGHTGSVNLDAWSGGAYWTHVGPSGWYLDAVLQGTVYSGNATTPESSIRTDGTGFIASLEGGYPIPLWFWPRLVLEPQAQILWQRVGFNHEFDGIQNVNLGSTSGPTGRLGLLAESTIVTDSGQVWQPYVRGNVWESWGAQASTTFGTSPIQVPLREQATWLEFAGGGTVKVNGNWSAYAQAGYQFAVAPSNVRRNGFTGDIGLRYTW
jgi:outer membrane autotransporter protein